MTNIPDSPTPKFRNKYRIPSARLVGYDYAQNGAYFVTICTHQRTNFLGHITNGTMVLSDVGAIVADEWQKTTTIRNYIELGQWVVMPNHFHAVVMINRGGGRFDRCDCRDVLTKRLYQTPKRLYNNKTNNTNKTTTNNHNTNAPTRKYTGNHPQMSAISPTKHSLSMVIRFFKRQTTIRSKQINPHFAWQPRFHDHIIRNQQEYHRISRYIYNNPANWDNDSYS
jgi:REP element-mobilizing transposase RayT